MKRLVFSGTKGGTGRSIVAGLRAGGMKCLGLVLLHLSGRSLVTFGLIHGRPTAAAMFLLGPMTSCIW